MSEGHRVLAQVSLMAVPRAVTLELAGVTGHWWPVGHTTRNGEDRRVALVFAPSASQQGERHD